MNAMFFKSNTAYGWGTCATACGGGGDAFTAYVTKGIGNTAAYVEAGDKLYSDDEKTIPLINDDYYYYPEFGGENCVLVTGSLGLVHSLTSCGPILSPSATPTRTPSQTAISNSPTRTRTISTSTVASCTAESLTLKGDSDTACAGGGSATYYCDPSFQNGAYVYTNLSCTTHSPAGWYSNGVTAFEKTTSTGTLGNGTLCV